FKAKILMIEEWNVAEGILELVDRFWIRTLVMGAASDKHHSKEMKVPQSKKAIKLMENAHPFCEIWFVCDQKVIFSRSPSEDLRSVPVFVDADDNFWDIENNLDTEGYLLAQKKDHALVISEQADTAQNAEGTHEKGDTVILEDLHGSGDRVKEKQERLIEAMVPAQANAHREVELLHQQKQEMIIKSEVAELRERSEQLMIERDNAVSKIRTLEGQKKQMMTEWNFATKQVVELRKQKRLVTIERDSALGEMKTYHKKAKQAKTEIKELQEQKERMMTELNFARGKIVELHKQKRQVTTERGNVLGQMNIFQKKTEKAKTEVKELQGEIKRLKTELNCADGEVMELHEQKEQMHSRWDSAIGKCEELCGLMKQMLTELEKVAEARRQKVLMMAERDHALEEAKKLMSQLEQIISQFTLVELQRATKDFNVNLKVGQGGFGVVYKGFLRNTTVAIKMLSSTGVQGQSDFKHEVTFMNTVRHPNVVTLVGACPEALALVYEFMPNGSLEGCLERVAGAPALSWQARTRIITEICSALSFLHKNTPYGIVHGDIKPANILLDGNLASKLCDFGTSRHLIHSDTAGSGMLCTSHPWGTPGYMDPEFHTTGVLTTRSDTYSFGVTILCVLTARSPLNLVRVVRDALERGDLRSVMDTSAGDWPIAQAKRLVRLALKCTEMTSDNRPDMAGEVWTVVKRLADEANGAAPTGQHGVGTSVQLNGQKLGIGMENPVYPCKCLSGIKIHSVAEAFKR
uniref:RING-type E3 ubiquitin transferase n=1 Tax=Setaria italica TaxID=4555 RepID=K3YNG9_SETIT